MQVSLTKTQGLERRLEVAVPGEQVEREVDSRLKKLARTARIKGFRPGKVPFAVVRQQYGGQVHAEAVNDLLQSSFAEAVAQQQLKPAGGPRIEPLQIAPGTELRYAATFEVLPEVKIPALDKLQVERPAADITDADVAEMLESMRRQRPVFTAVERAAGDGDRVTINYEGRIDGEIFPGGQNDGFKVVLGAGTILAELDAAMHGMKVGDTKVVPARFPDDYGASSVAGKQAEFIITVTAIEERSLPEIDEAFARGFGFEQGSVEAFREEVRNSMERELADAIRLRQRDALLDALFKASPLDLPKVLVDEQVQELQLQMLRRAGVQKVEQLPPREPYEEPARKRVALGLLIGEIIRSQSLTVDRERLQQRLEAVVAGHPDADNMRRQYLQSREAMQQLESLTLEDQALEWALSQVRQIDKPSNFRELTGFGSTAGG